MSTEKTQLEVGDFVTREYFGQLSIYEITRVTAKRAFAKALNGYKISFNRVLRGTHVDRPYQSDVSYHLTTDADREKIKRSNLIGLASKLRFDLMTTDQLERILSISKEVQP